jgi:hypothetical protein
MKSEATEREVTEQKPESIAAFEFEKSDIQREEVVKEVLDIYDF